MRVNTVSDTWMAVMASEAEKRAEKMEDLRHCTAAYVERTRGFLDALDWLVSLANEKPVQQDKNSY